MAKEIISITPFNNGAATVVVPSGLVNSAVVFAIGTHQGTISSCSWNGNALTKVDSGATAFNECGDLWILLNPTAGSGSTSVSMSGGSWYGGAAYVIQGVKQTTSPTHANTNGSSSSASVTVDTPVGNVLIFMAMGAEADATSSTPPTATRTSQQGSSFENFSGLVYSLATGEKQTPAFGLSSGQRWGVAIMALEDPATESEVLPYNHFEVGNGMSVTDRQT